MPGKGGKQNPSKVTDQGQRKGCRISFGLPISPVRYLKHVGVKVAAAVVRITARAPPPKPHRSNPAPPPRTSVAPIDSQRAEAIHDCIDFINSSSTLPRSNSVAR